MFRLLHIVFHDIVFLRLLRVVFHNLLGIVTASIEAHCPRLVCSVNNGCIYSVGISLHSTDVLTIDSQKVTDVGGNSFDRVRRGDAQWVFSTC